MRAAGREDTLERAQRHYRQRGPPSRRRTPAATAWWHECILDVRPLEKTSGIGAEDVAKRLIDFGFHAPP